MSRLLELETFVEVVRQGSLSAAGRRLGLAPSVVADRVSTLEKRLGARLLLRTTRRQTLTEAGTICYEDARRLLAEFRSLESRVAGSAASSAGPLRITAPVPLGRRWIAPFVGQFTANHPEISVHLSLDDQYVDILENGFDIAIRGGPAVDSGFIGHRLFESRRVVVASPSYIARHGAPDRPEALDAHRCLIFNTHPHFRAEWRFGRGTEAQSVTVKGLLASTDSSLPVAWALDGLGLTQKSWWEVSAHVQQKRLVTVLDDFEPEPATFFAIHPVSRSQSRKVALFVEGLAAALIGIA